MQDNDIEKADREAGCRIARLQKSHGHLVSKGNRDSNDDATDADIVDQEIADFENGRYKTP